MTPEATAGPTLPEPKLFISYRRGETSAYAGRLYDSMAATFGDGNVFMDVDLKPGIDFVDRITSAVSACHVLIVVMGPRWASTTDEDGAVRLADPEDFVRLEVGTALKRSDVTVIPVLVSGAKMPDGDDLPAEVRALTRRNALELSDGRWRYDIDRLITRLEELLGGTTAIHETVALHPQPDTSDAATVTQPTLTRQASPVRILIEGVLVAAVIGLISGGLANALPNNLSDLDQVLKRVGIWTPVALGIAIWLTVRFGQRGIGRNLVLALALGASAAALSGVITFYPEDQAPGDLVVKAPSYAVIGFALGTLMGTLWVPRRVGTGMVAGIVAGLVVGLVVPAGQGAPVFWVTVRAIGIIGGTLVGLLAADRQSTSVAPTPDRLGSGRGAPA